MILAIDIGNSHIVMGVYKRKELVSHWRISTQKNLTGDDYGVTLANLIPLKELKGIIICSVVPYLESEFTEWFKRNTDLEPILLTKDLDIGITLDYENKQEIGADRIANAVGAYYLYRKGCLIVDLGTAITFDLISKEGTYLGGAIAPGIEISSQALFASADLLHPISIEFPLSIVGKNTTESVRIGILYGFTSMIEGMITRFKEKINFIPLIVLTGGWAQKISKVLKSPHKVNLFLTLEGLRILYERNRPPASNHKS